MPNQKVVLIVNPTVDDKTTEDCPGVVYYCYKIRQPVYDKANELYNAQFLFGDDVTYEKVRDALQQHDPIIYLANGHGYTNVQTGQYFPETESYEVIFQLNDNEDWLNGRIVYFLSCYCGAELGRSIVEKGGAIAFIGYNDTFTFVWKLEEYKDHPERDPYATSCLKPSNIIEITLLETKDPDKAFDEGINAFYQEIEKWRQSDDPLASAVLSSLIHNKDALVKYKLGEEFPCREGDVKCEGYDLYECVDGRWQLREENSRACGYVPPTPPRPAPAFPILPFIGFGFTSLLVSGLKYKEKVDIEKYKLEEKKFFETLMTISLLLGAIYIGIKAKKKF